MMNLVASITEYGDDPDTNEEAGHENPGSEDGQVDRETAELRRIGAIAKNVFSEIYDGWDRQGDSERGIEAQVAAACLGLKPLYFDPWGETFAILAAGRFAGRLPRGVEVRVAKDHLFIYRPEIVEPFLQADPRFYRPHDETTWAAIERVSPQENGELLGYGCRSMLAGDVQVIIHAAEEEWDHSWIEEQPIINSFQYLKSACNRPVYDWPNVLS